MLVQRFFTEHLTHHRAVSPRTVAAYGDTLRLLLQFAERRTCKSPTRLKLVDLDAKLVLAFLDHLERDRNNGPRSRNARLAALRSFLKYAAHHDLSALGVIEQALAVRGEGPLEGDERVEPGDEGSEDLYQDELDAGRREELQEELAAVERAEARLAAGTYGLSVESGEPIPEARLEARPTAERTVEEEDRYRRG